MTDALLGAINALRGSGVTETDLSRLKSEAPKAQNGKTWSGTKRNGDPWSLKKANDNSYWSSC